VEKSDFSAKWSHPYSTKSVAKDGNNCLKTYDHEVAKSRTSSFTNIDGLRDVNFLVTCVNKIAATRPCECHLKLLMKN